MTLLIMTTLLMMMTMVVMSSQATKQMSSDSVLLEKGEAKAEKANANFKSAIAKVAALQVAFEPACDRHVTDM